MELRLHIDLARRCRSHNGRGLRHGENLKGIHDTEARYTCVARELRHYSARKCHDILFV